MDKNALRKRLRTQRAKLNDTLQLEAAKNLAHQSLQCKELMRAKRVLSYQAFAGEIDPSLILARLSNYELFLPTITDFKACLMSFYPAADLEPPNRYGIREPKAQGQAAEVDSFDVILMPLVGFDRKGARIGMGAGYYDRALEALKDRIQEKPFLIGIAHQFQECQELKPEPWDVPLNAILTDCEFIRV